MAAVARKPLETAHATHPGMVREVNEDAVYVDALLGLAVLADGMGGYNAGEVASSLAVTTITEGLRPYLGGGRALGKVDVSSGFSHAGLLLREQILLANQKILAAALAKPEYAGMGTTVVGALFYDNRLCLAHIGDSRAYRFRAGRLEQITRDHSLLQEQIEYGLITPEQARTSSQKNLLTRALGIEGLVEPEITEFRVEAGDVFLICSDGLSDVVDNETIERVLREGPPALGGKVAELVRRANDAGGPDNISIVVVRVPEGYTTSSNWWERWVPAKGEAAS